MAILEENKIKEGQGGCFSLKIAVVRRYGGYYFSFNNAL